ncbi:hypothetical protein FOZ61_003440 [Perkinsus olseni]|uniref:Uncharacterized protein n=1 Tax=Perkinsus olseni TaxID=32597 RepID=A0A7J6LQS1_PEROL|nr:hypothetical protein FOZ61_003440 [Perkinsus olseni]
MAQWPRTVKQRASSESGHTLSVSGLIGLLTMRIFAFAILTDSEGTSTNEFDEKFSPQFVQLLENLTLGEIVMSGWARGLFEFLLLAFERLGLVDRGAVGGACSQDFQDESSRANCFYKRVLSAANDGDVYRVLGDVNVELYCIFMTDSRAVETVGVAKMSNASVVTLTYEANKLYCKILGNCGVYFNVPDSVADYPERKVGWGKISVMIREMSRREEECEFGVSIDTDAYFRTRENLDNIVEDFELDGPKLVGIAEEFHQEELGQ